MTCCPYDICERREKKREESGTKIFPCLGCGQGKQFAGDRRGGDRSGFILLGVSLEKSSVKLKYSFFGLNLRGRDVSLRSTI